MTEHEKIKEKINSLNKYQRYVLGCIAMGIHRWHHPITLETLLKKELIRLEERKQDDILGIFIWKSYYVSNPVYRAWREWDAENANDDEEKQMIKKDKIPETYSVVLNESSELTSLNNSWVKFSAALPTEAGDYVIVNSLGMKAYFYLSDEAIAEIAKEGLQSKSGAWFKLPPYNSNFKEEKK